MAFDQNQDVQDYVPQDAPAANSAQNAPEVNAQYDPYAQQAPQQPYTDYAQTAGQQFTNYAQDAGQQYANYAQNTQQQFANYAQDAGQQYASYAQNTQQQFANYTQDANQQFTNYAQTAQQQYTDYAQTAQQQYTDYTQAAQQQFGYPQQDTASYQPVQETAPVEDKVESFDTTADLSASVPVDSFSDPNAGLDPEPFAMPGVSKAFTVFKKNGGSAAVTIGSILLGLTVLFSLINPILIWTHVWPQVDQLLKSSFAANLPATIIGIQIPKFIYWSVLVSTVLFTLPMVLYVIGLCIYSIRARRHEMPGDEDVGLTPLKAGMVIYLVFWILSVLGCGYAVYTSVIALLAGVKLTKEVWTVLILQGCWLAIEILGLIYFIKSIRMVNSAARVFATGEMPRHNLPLFVIVVNYILIVLNIVVAFPMILAGDYAIPVLLNFAMLVLRVAAGLLLNIPLHIARSELKRARESE